MVSLKNGETSDDEADEEADEEVDLDYHQPVCHRFTVSPPSVNFSPLPARLSPLPASFPGQLIQSYKGYNNMPDPGISSTEPNTPSQTEPDLVHSLNEDPRGGSGRSTRTNTRKKRV